MSSISSVAPASTSTSTPPPTLKTIVTVVAHGHGAGPMDLTGLTMHQSPVDGGGGGVSTHKGSGSPGPIANNPIIEAFQNFLKGAEQGGGAYLAQKAMKALWGQYGSSIMSALGQAGKNFVDFLNSAIDEAGQWLTDPASGAKTSQTQTPASSTLTAADKALALNLVSSAQKAGVLPYLSSAVQAVYAGMQSAGSIVNTTA